MQIRIHGIAYVTVGHLIYYVLQLLFLGRLWLQLGISNMEESIRQVVLDPLESNG